MASTLTTVSTAIRVTEALGAAVYASPLVACQLLGPLAMNFPESTAAGLALHCLGWADGMELQKHESGLESVIPPLEDELINLLTQFSAIAGVALSVLFIGGQMYFVHVEKENFRIPHHTDLSNLAQAHYTKLSTMQSIQ